jgi:hypothetical protein
LKVFKNAWLGRFARKEQISAAALLGAALCFFAKGSGAFLCVEEVVQDD